jgi:hypothetical protein
VAIDPKDLGELQKALNEAAGKASVLWTTFITFQLYLAIAFGSVTHRDLFLETSIKLPLLNVDLALVGFFVVAPLLLLIFHFYLFLQPLGLASKAKDYNTLLVDEAPAASDRRSYLGVVWASCNFASSASIHVIEDLCCASSRPASSNCFRIANAFRK